MRAVDVLPFVPVRCTTRKDSCGSPISRVSAAMRSSEGSRRVSGQRPCNACSTSEKEGLISPSIAVGTSPLRPQGGMRVFPHRQPSVRRAMMIATCTTVSVQRAQKDPS